MPECLVVKEGGSYHNDKSLFLQITYLDCQEGEAVFLGAFLGAKRLDIVSDTYQNCSIKDARGIEETVNFNEDDYMPETSKMKDFFQSSVNKKN